MSFCIPSVSAPAEQPESDDRLVERLVQQDPSAFDELYSKYGKRVYSTIYRIVRSRVVAEDLAQEVFLKAWSRANDFKRGSSRSLATWIIAIARNRSIDYIRSTEGRMNRASREFLNIDKIAYGCDAEERIARDRQIARLESAVDKLGADHRRVVGLIYFEGLTQIETANRQSRPLGTIKSWVRQALVALRHDLAELAPLEPRP